MSDRTIDRAHRAYIGLYGYDDPAEGFSPEQDERLTTLLRAERLKAGDCPDCAGEYQAACPWCRSARVTNDTYTCPECCHPVQGELISVCGDCGAARHA